MSVGWVAYGGDGRVWNNSDHVYGDIDRSVLSGFDLLVNDHPVLMVVVHPHEVGQFTYRKRTRKFVGGGGQVMHVVGFADSHAWVYDEQCRVVFAGSFGDEHDVVDFSLPIPHPYEGESF